MTNAFRSLGLRHSFVIPSFDVFVIGFVMSTSSAGSVTHWIGELQAGDDAAALNLWDHYFQRLVSLARQKLEGSPRRAADEEDVALSAFASFCRHAQDGRFPRLRDRDDLWRLLIVITARTALHLVRDEGRQKRGGGVLNQAPPTNGPEAIGLAQLIGREPAPEFAAQVADECRHLLDELGHGELRSVALWKMEGFTNREIAERLGYVTRTIERKLRLIRRIWAKELTP